MTTTRTIKAPIEFDLSTCHRMDAETDAAGPGTQLVVDMRQTTFIDSTGIGWLLRAQRRLEPTGGAVVVQASSEVRRVLEVSGVDQVVAVLAA